MARVNGSKRLDKDGVPINQDDWTLEDWRDLWAGINRIKARIAKRHRVVTQGTHVMEGAWNAATAYKIRKK